MEARTRPPSLDRHLGHTHGDQRRTWSEPFLDYAYALVEHDAYAGIPAARDDDGKLDWTVPTGRKPGSKNWDGNLQRREWWKARADELGIAVEGAWISTTAKAIHPWGWKPCQTCGRWMRITYAYPTKRTVEKLNVHLPADAQLDDLDYLDIYEVTEHLVATVGFASAKEALGHAFATLANGSRSTDMPGLQLEIEERVVAQEPRGRLSPGAMANPPDRLDGFHTYNLCCRSKQDTGRSLDNLKTYGVDRRAFEHWSEGDWEAANLLMSKVGVGPCPRCGNTRQLTADHIGPISLGFRHTPRFNPLCGPCNSAKNNRMSLADVGRLIELEEAGETVVSWHAAPLWDATKGRIDSDDGALRLSKLLNVNQHEFIRLLVGTREAHLSDALLQFLSPEYAEDRVEFVGLDLVTLEYTEIRRRTRQITYARSKAARLIRIAMDSLDEYAEKAKRNVQAVPRELLADEAAHVEEAVAAVEADASGWRVPLEEALAIELPASVRENRLHELIGPGFYEPTHDYGELREAFGVYMKAVGTVLAARLDDDRAIKEWENALEDV